LPNFITVGRELFIVSLTDTEKFYCKFVTGFRYTPILDPVIRDIFTNCPPLFEIFSPIAPHHATLGVLSVLPFVILVVQSILAANALTATKLAITTIKILMSGSFVSTLKDFIDNSLTCYIGSFTCFHMSEFYT